MTPATGTGARRITTGRQSYIEVKLGEWGHLIISNCIDRARGPAITVPDDPFVRVGLAGLIAPEGYQLVRADSLKRLKRLAACVIAVGNASQTEFSHALDQERAATLLIQPEDYE